MRISLIVAMDQHWLIGDAHGLPWQLPADLRRFRRLTVGKPIIMGRKTLDHLGRPLPDRLNIVLTRQRNFAVPGCTIAHSLPEALGAAEATLPELGGDEIMVVGGAEIFREALPLAERIHLTIVAGKFTGNAWFPHREAEQYRYRIVHDEMVLADEKNRQPHRFLILDRSEKGMPLEELIG